MIHRAPRPQSSLGLALTVVLLAGVLNVSCIDSSSPGIRIEDQDTMQSKLRPVIGDPIFVPDSRMVIYPFAAEGDATEKSAWGISSGSLVMVGSAASGIGSYGKASGSSSLRWNNVIVYDPTANASRLLFDKPTLICHFYLPDKERGPVFGKYLLYGVAQHDTNSDGMINDDDAVVLMATDLDGKVPPLRLSPADGQLVELAARKDDPSWLYYGVRRDSDGDKRFTNKDRIDPYRIQPEEVLRSGTDGEPHRIPLDEVRATAFEVVLKAAGKPMR